MRRDPLYRDRAKGVGTESNENGLVVGLITAC